MYEINSRKKGTYKMDEQKKKEAAETMRRYQEAKQIAEENWKKLERQRHEQWIKDSAERTSRFQNINQLIDKKKNSMER